MIVCEYCFDYPDPKNPSHSSTEVDVYAWISAHPDMANHRLSVRKNLLTGEYEAYRHFIQQLLVKRAAGIMIRNESAEKLDQVAFTHKSLQAVLDFTTKESEEYHGHAWTEGVCEHAYPKKAAFCKGRRELQAGMMLEIFEDPITCKRSEGIAKLIKVQNDADDERQSWRVEFLADKGTKYVRWIKT